MSFLRGFSVNAVAGVLTFALAFAIAIALAGVLGMGIMPGPFIETARAAAAQVPTGAASASRGPATEPAPADRVYAPKK